MVFDGLFDALMVYLYSLVNGHVGQILERDENEKKKDAMPVAALLLKRFLSASFYRWEGNENTQ